MNDVEYIKAAVELADGWRLSDDAEPIIYLTNDTNDDYDGMSFMSWSYPTWMLDALAAQLVRQVDVLNYLVMVVASKEGTSIVQPDVTFYNPGCNDGRTINTIKAIVDSEVLTND